MSTSMMNEQLSKQTSIFGLSLWIVLGVSVGAAFVLLLFLLSLWLTSTRPKTDKPNSTNPHPAIPIVSREIQEVRIDRIQPDPCRESEQLTGVERQALLLKKTEEEGMMASGHPRICIEMGKGHRILYPERLGAGGKSGDQVMGMVVEPQVSHLGWGHWYTLRELESSTNGFADCNVIGQGGYGIVYHGVLEGNHHVAVKNLLNNRGQAEKEFEVEVEAIGRVRHKNLVRLIGYCAEGAHRILVYEYVNNGNLEQWLHGDVGPSSPLTWDIRMNIILGTAKG